MPSSLTMILPPALGFSPCPPVSVCGTGACGAIAAFPGTGSACFATCVSLRLTPSLPAGVFPPARYGRLHRYFPSRHTPCQCVPAVLAACSAGISTCCPSATPSGLALGPDLPRADRLYPGNLGHPARGIPTPVSLLIPAFSLPGAPPPLAVRLRRAGDAPLPATVPRGSRASAACFSPGHFRRGTPRPVSCYALFECVAASEPTSWLSLESHILSHLTRTWGPWPRVWALSLSAARLISCSLTPVLFLSGIRSLVFFGRL